MSNTGTLWKDFLGLEKGHGFKFCLSVCCHVWIFWTLIGYSAIQNILMSKGSDLDWSWGMQLLNLTGLHTFFDTQVTVETFIFSIINVLTIINCVLVQLVVHLEDDNDNAPVFELSTYTNVTSEGTPINSLLFSGK